MPHRHMITFINAGTIAFRSSPRVWRAVAEVWRLIAVHHGWDQLRLNELLLQNNHEELFVTVFYGIFDRRTGSSSNVWLIWVGIQERRVATTSHFQVRLSKIPRAKTTNGQCQRYQE